MCLDSGKIPELWRRAIIAPIPKSDQNDPRIPLNYRGISLICCSAKLYNALLNTRIESYLNANNKLVDEQNGFRKDRSCQDHLYVLDSLIRNRKNENLSTFTAFIDLQKAFDCVNRDFLMHKILNMGIEGKIYMSIKSLYSATEACVKISNDLYSEWFPTLFGVRQGDSLSPTLFSMYLNDLANDIKELRAGVDINGKNVGILLYADDIALIAPSEASLQLMLDKVAQWSAKWKINMNRTK